MIPVTKTFFPPIKDYFYQVQRIWDNAWITNRGELVKELERILKDYLDIDNIILTTNGTLPIQIALKTLAAQGEVITTPFTYVATTAALIWENCTPVFVDIDPVYLTIDETKIEAAITNKTTAILATHVFGNPCNVEAIERLAVKHNLKVIYDAAHGFGVEYKNLSLFSYGDVSTCSFHATKIFHTGEGGAMFCKNEKINHKLFYSHNFGHNGPIDFHGPGINAKMSELQAALGLTVFPFMGEIIKERKNVIDFYDKNLDSGLQRLKIRENTKWNYSYYPVIFKNEKQLLKVQKALNDVKIFPRRYFYPSLNNLKFVISPAMEVSDKISESVLCLPLYNDLKIVDLKTIVDIINKNIL